MKIGDRSPTPQPSQHPGYRVHAGRARAKARQRIDFGAHRVGDVLRDRRDNADAAAAEQQHGRPSVIAVLGNAQARQGEHEGQGLPLDRVWQKREWMHVGAIDRRKRRRPPDARVDARPGKRPHERERAVNPPAPKQVAVEELFRMMRHQPGFALTVADLLAPVRGHRGAMPMPDQRGRSEADLPAPRLQPPAHIHIVAGPEVDWVESADREERFAPERHVAAGHVLRDPIVEQHVRRASWRARDALGHRRIVGWDNVGPT